MRTTIDIPDPLYKKAKATAALRGVKLRVLFTEALMDYFSADTPAAGQAEASAAVAGVTTTPKVTAKELAEYPDGEALRRAFPNGYRIVGPLIGIGESAEMVLATRVAEAEAQMDAEELDSYGRAR